MRTMKTIATLLSLLACSLAFASGGADVRMDPAPIHRLDAESLQRGARNFVNYCLNCHSAKYMRYERLKDIGLTEDQIKGNLMFGTDKIGSTMTVAMTPAEARSWFNAVPPDLSVEARVRGADWLYNYLLAFYRDDKAPTGWNNLVFPNVGMPHVLWQLQGEREPQFDTEKQHGHEVKVFKGWKQVTPGALTPLQYDQAVGDLVGYLQWMAEPAQNHRVRVGAWVLMFLTVLTVFVWRLNAAFWKDVK